MAVRVISLLRSGWSDDEFDLSDNADPDSIVYAAHPSKMQISAVQHASAPGHVSTFTQGPEMNRPALRSNLSHTLSCSLCRPKGEGQISLRLIMP